VLAADVDALDEVLAGFEVVGALPS